MRTELQEGNLSAAPYAPAVTFAAHVVRIMIASPGDAIEARDAIERAARSRNDANSVNRAVVLLPWRWETSAVPQMGDHPQALINSQGLDEADIVFEIFWGRLGSPTAAADFGTVEEIERAIAAGEHVHLYFSTAPLPIDVDTEQLSGLRTFKEAIQARGLLGEFHNPDQLFAEVWRCVEADLAALNLSGAPSAQTRDPISFLVQEDSDMETTYVRGEPRSSRRLWIDITNRSTTHDAEDVSFELVGEPAMRLIVPDELVTIHAGQRRRLPLARFLGGSQEARLRISWTEEGERKSCDYDFG